jgi:hypothetical protein
MMPTPPGTDHLVYAVPDLAAGVAAMATRLGLEPSPGGPHPGLGTRNFLVSLGQSCYLEIIGPDPDQPTPARPRPFGIDEIGEGQLVTWAIHDSDLEARLGTAREKGYDAGQILPLSRQSPGGLLEWRLTMREDRAADGLVPFLIDWGTTPNPATTSVQGCTLLGLRAEHPDPVTARQTLAALDVELEVASASHPALIARIATPIGEVDLS